MSLRYWLFAYEDCYPAGGMRDFVAASDSVAELKSLITTGDRWEDDPGGEQELRAPRAEPYTTSLRREWYRSIDQAHIVRVLDARVLCHIDWNFKWKDGAP